MSDVTMITADGFAGDLVNLRNRLLRFVRRRVRDRHTAEDIVQETLLKAHLRAGSNRPGALGVAANPQAWLLTVARHAIADHFRSPGVVRRRPLQDAHEPASEAETGLVEGEQRRALARCVSGMTRCLGADQRDALLLADQSGIPQRDLARRFGTSLSAMKSRIQRARRMLLSLVQQCCRVETDRRGRIVSFGSRTECPGESCPGAGAQLSEQAGEGTAVGHRGGISGNCASFCEAERLTR